MPIHFKRNAAKAALLMQKYAASVLFVTASAVFVGSAFSAEPDEANLTIRTTSLGFLMASLSLFAHVKTTVSAATKENSEENSDIQREHAGLIKKPTVTVAYSPASSIPSSANQVFGMASPLFFISASSVLAQLNLSQILLNNPATNAPAFTLTAAGLFIFASSAAIVAGLAKDPNIQDKAKYAMLTGYWAGGVFFALGNHAQNHGFKHETQAQKLGLAVCGLFFAGNTVNPLALLAEKLGCVERLRSVVEKEYQQASVI